MSFRKDGVTILLGAGCSKDAGIPTSKDMIGEIEDRIIQGAEVNRIKWGKFKHLYYCIKSSILYGEGIRGTFGNNVTYNIEKLVNTLAELEKRETHPIYPFIGSWNMKLLDLAGNGFENVKLLRESIVAKLKDWVTIGNYSKASYYCRLFDFKKEYNFPLRVFSLNYDLCMEKHSGAAVLERGFDDKRIWEWRRFEENENALVDVYLYKMHGSIDWERSEGNLTFSDEVTRIANPDLIFGTNYKLQYVDPYLFFAYEFRRYTLESQLILTIGYGFGDEHINGIVGQALQSEPTRRLLAVLPTDDGGEEEKKKEIRQALQGKYDDQIHIKNLSAKKFMEEELTVESLGQTIPPEEDILKAQS